MLFPGEMKVKIVNSGLYTPLKDSPLNTLCGSPSYAALELFLGRSYDGPAVDAGSLGVLLYKSVTKDLRQLGEWILREKYTVPSYFPSQRPNFLNKLITPNPQERSRLRDIMPDRWLNMGQEEELKPH